MAAWRLRLNVNAYQLVDKTLTKLQLLQDEHSTDGDQGRRHGFESGGDKVCERSEQKYCLHVPSTFVNVGGTKS